MNTMDQKLGYIFWYGVVAVSVILLANSLILFFS